MYLFMLIHLWGPGLSLCSCQLNAHLVYIIEINKSGQKIPLDSDIPKN